MNNDKDSPTEGIQTERTIQNHSGIGNNVGRDLVINQAISPKALLLPIQRILTDLRYRQPDQAKDQLSTLKATSNLDTDAVGVLNTIQLLIDLAEDNPPADAYQQLGTYLNTTNDLFCRDITTSAQIRLDSKNDNPSDALSRYNAIETPGAYTNEAYYEFIAGHAEIEDAFENRKLQLTEVELCGLVRGTLRLKIPAGALSIAKYLHSISPNFNSKVFIAISEANTFDSENLLKHYWSITASSQRELLRQCNDVIDLLNECKGKDPRVVGLSASLLNFVFGEYKPLADACWYYISEIEAQLPDIAANIRHTYEQRPSNLDGILYKIAKAQEDPQFRNKIITEITRSTEISADDSTLLSNVSDKKSIQNWLESGGTISSTDQFEKDFSLLELMVLACNNDRSTSDDLRAFAEEFINNYRARLPELNPPRLLDLADKLIDAGVSTAACELLKPHIPSSDIWASPIVRCYINALLDSQQMMTLNSTLAEINQKDWNGYIWRIKARQLGQQHMYPEAIDAIERALIHTPLSCYAWFLLIYLHRQNKSNEELIIQTLSRIPSEIFNKASDLGYQLLAEIAVTGDFVKAESHLINWFINNPDNCAIPFTNFYLSVTIEGNCITKPATTVGDCIGGVRYATDGKITTKLLVTDEVESHQSLLKISSPLGQLLSEMAVGDTEQYNMLDIELIERSPPFIAAFNIATTLRQALNDGTDCFHSFDLPKDPDEMFKSLERKLVSANKGSNALDAQPNIPLFMKGFRFNTYDPVKSALYQLTKKESVKQALPGFGEEVPKQIILDVYSSSYLALTGLAFNLQDSQVNTVITIETKHYIEQWLRDVNQKDYLSIGVHPDGGLWRNTIEDIRRQTADVQKALNLIITRSEVVTPNLVDMPPEILRVEDLVDLSVLSSLKLSITNDIPWLCIDLTFAQLSQVSGYKTVNAFQFFSLLGRGLPIEKKQKGIYLHVIAGLPYSLTYEDMIQLSKSKEEHAHYFLAELLKVYPEAFSNTNDAIQFLDPILGSILLNAYLDGDILNGLREFNPGNNGYTELVFNVCCYISMQCDDGQKAEHKFAMLLSQLLFRFRGIQSMNKLIRQMASRFIAGHFMSFDAVNKHTKELINTFTSNETP